MKYTVPKLHCLARGGHLACVSGSAATTGNIAMCVAGPFNHSLGPTSPCKNGANAKWTQGGWPACVSGYGAVGSVAGGCGIGNAAVTTGSPPAACVAGNGV